MGNLVRVVLLVVGLMFVSSVMRGVVDGGPSAGQATDVPGGGSYRNEDYQPPPADATPPELPAPQTVAEAEAYLERNPLYAEAIASPTNCPMAALDARTASKAQMQTHLNDLMGCLMAVWEPPADRAGFEMPRPPVTVYSSPVTTACGVMKEVNAAYCAGDQRVYYAQPLLRALPADVARTTYAAEMIIAHEFGHAVQARTGILVSDKALEQRASKNQALVMSRRTETQADCLAAQYVRSVARSQELDVAKLTDLQDMAYNLGDDVLSNDPTVNEGHGLGRSRRAWFTTGLGSDQIGVCNTWVAPAASVR